VYQRRDAGVRPKALVRGPFALLGPAFVAAIAYVDPGNFATNVTAGSTYGYLLLWVLVLGNAMAMLVQYLSAKAGIATGLNLAELCREHSRPWVRVGLWLQAEVVAIATDVAEVLGGALALNLLFGAPLLVGALITSAVALALLEVQSRGVRPFEVVVAGLLLVILGGFTYSLVAGGVDLSAAGAGLQPRFDGPSSLVLAAAMLGATVMPHVIYLHGSLTQARYRRATEAQRHALLRCQRIDVVIALTLAGLVNIVMLVVAARVLGGGHGPPVTTLEQAHAGLGAALGPTAALLFAVALLASGLAASGVGTLSGQVVMQGLLRRRIPVMARRLVTLVPALVVVASGLDVTTALVGSQVVLSFGIPFALIPLVLLTRRRDLMGSLVNARSTTAVAVLVTAVVVSLNLALIWGTVRSA